MISEDLFLGWRAMQACDLECMSIYIILINNYGWVDIKIIEDINVFC